MIQKLSRFPWIESSESFAFPDVESSSGEGLLCYGGNLSPGVLLSAYRQGIFPWYGEGEPILWWSPDPRFVLTPELLHFSDSAKKLIKRKLRGKDAWRLRLDGDFLSVISACSRIRRPKQNGTWIVPEMIEAYERLHGLGYAHSVEVMEGEDLVGGLYGVSLGKAFFGESMFSAESGASRVGFLAFASFLFEKGFSFIDCQVNTEYLAGMGAIELGRRQYIGMLSNALAKSSLVGDWGAQFPDFPVSSELSQLLG